MVKIYAAQFGLCWQLNCVLGSWTKYTLFAVVCTGTGEYVCFKVLLLSTSIADLTSVILVGVGVCLALGHVADMLARGFPVQVSGDMRNCVSERFKCVAILQTSQRQVPPPVRTISRHAPWNATDCVTTCTVNCWFHMFPLEYVTECRISVCAMDDDDSGNVVAAD